MTTLEILRVIASAAATSPGGGASVGQSSAREVAHAWQALSEHLDRRYRLPPREHADVRQRTLLKVWKAAVGIEADSVGRAEAWLRRVHMSARAEHHRAIGTRMMDAALKSTPADGDLAYVVDHAALAKDVEPSVRTRADEGERLDAALSEVLDRVTEWLEHNVSIARKRQGDYRRAQVALLANVRGLDGRAIIEALGIDPPPSKSAIYKWVERGREQVLLPAIAGWEHPIAGALAAQLVASRRADAGKPRVGRRTSVSREEEGSSLEERSPEDE